MAVRGAESFRVAGDSLGQTQKPVFAKASPMVRVEEIGLGA